MFSARGLSADTHAPNPSLLRWASDQIWAMATNRWGHAYPLTPARSEVQASLRSGDSWAGAEVLIVNSGLFQFEFSSIYVLNSVDLACQCGETMLT
jgi:hypothetical protein